LQPYHGEKNYSILGDSYVELLLLCASFWFR